MSLPRATCPACHRDVAVRNNDAFREHRSPDGAICDGSGRTAEAIESDALRADCFERWRAGGAAAMTTLDLRAAAQHAQAMGERAVERELDGVINVREAQRR